MQTLSHQAWLSSPVLSTSIFLQNLTMMTPFSSWLHSLTFDLAPLAACLKGAQCVHSTSEVMAICHRSQHHCSLYATAPCDSNVCPVIEWGKNRFTRLQTNERGTNFTRFFLYMEFWFCMSTKQSSKVIKTPDWKVQAMFISHCGLLHTFNSTDMAHEYNVRICYCHELSRETL